MWTGTRTANKKQNEDKKPMEEEPTGDDEGHMEGGDTNYEEGAEEETPREADPVIEPEVSVKKPQNSKDAKSKAGKTGKKEKGNDEQGKGESSSSSKQKRKAPQEKEQKPQKKTKPQGGEAKAVPEETEDTKKDTQEVPAPKGVLNKKDGVKKEKKENTEKKEAPKGKPAPKEKAKAAGKAKVKGKADAKTKPKAKANPGSDSSSSSSSSSNSEGGSTLLDEDMCKDEAALESEAIPKKKPACKSTAKSKEGQAKATAAKSNVKIVRLKRLQSRVRRANEGMEEPTRPAAEAAAGAGVPAKAETPATYDFFEEPQLHVANL